MLVCCQPIEWILGFLVSKLSSFTPQPVPPEWLEEGAEPTEDKTEPLLAEIEALKLRVGFLARFGFLWNCIIEKSI